MNARDPNLPVQPDEARALAAYAHRSWDEQIVPALTDYIAIPAKSPMFDADWHAHGYLDRVVRDAAAWVEGRKVAGLKLEVLRLEGRTPLICFEVPATSGRRSAPRPDSPARAGGAEGGAQASGTASGETVVFYGHLDKQPEFNGWRNDLGPWTPKYENGKLYGRGGADDGYAVYAAITAIESLDAQGIPRPRCVGIIESCEESGSGDLPAYLDVLKDRLGQVGLVVCLDSGAGSYDQLWLTTSLRGMVSGMLKVEVLSEGIHSGDASGVVPSSFRILRHLLDRLEDSRSGELLPKSFHCEIPAQRIEQARATAAILKDEVYKRFPWACGADGGVTLPTTTDPVQVLMNRTWRPTLSVTGVDGIPELGNAGNVLRPYTAFKLSLRLPPLVDGHEASMKLKALLEDNAPYNAKVSFHPDGRAGAEPGRGSGSGSWGATGWNAPALAPWLEHTLNAASNTHFGAPLGYIGQGGTIPLMSMLQKGFPKAQMMVCGVLGPKSNAHGPNEFLHVPYGKKLTAAVAQVVAACP
ncbi:MAG TPA: M20 family metallopeptidase [Rubrivivax sp.]|nr:M20 family metallopeptidase [Rubrivivax sp.]